MPRVERRRAGLNPAKVKRKTGSHKKGGKGYREYRADVLQEMGTKFAYVDFLLYLCSGKV